nr:MAG TPA: hypothetical protein [Caudoviricetes sp.]
MVSIGNYVFITCPLLSERKKALEPIDSRANSFNLLI